MPTVVERMASSVHALLTLEGETFGALRPRRAQLRQGFGRQSGQSRYQQDDEAADEGAPTEGADAEPWQRFQHAGSPPCRQGSPLRLTTGLIAATIFWTMRRYPGQAPGEPMLRRPPATGRGARHFEIRLDAFPRRRRMMRAADLRVAMR
jgi:hypothetical protein